MYIASLLSLLPVFFFANILVYLACRTRRYHVAEMGDDEEEREEKKMTILFVEIIMKGGCTSIIV